MLDFARLFKAIGYSVSGFRDALRDEPAFRQESALALILIPLAVWLGDSNIERALMIGALLIVLIAELLNSAIEAAVDRIGSEVNELSRKAKDLGSAAVFLALALAVVIWALMLLN
ncbi:MAG: diacylglycerol kinase [Chloroflexi bacterium]|nr:diacylglycerol kinase [Chloroflexota bacterium]